MQGDPAQTFLVPRLSTVTQPRIRAPSSHGCSSRSAGALPGDGGGGHALQQHPSSTGDLPAYLTDGDTTTSATSPRSGRGRAGVSGRPSESQGSPFGCYTVTQVKRQAGQRVGCSHFLTTRAHKSATQQSSSKYQTVTKCMGRATQQRSCC